METMKHRLLALAAYILFAVPCLAQYEVGIPSELLAAYLRSAKADEKQDTEARAVAAKSQVIYLHYDNSEPSREPAEDSRFALAIKASLVVPISHHAEDGKTYPKIDLVFSRLYGDARDATAAQWLEEMKRPFARGFVLTSVRVVPTPSDSVRQKTDEIAAGIIRDFASGLADLKTDFPELASFRAESVRGLGVSFNYGLGPASKAGRDKLSKQWCEVGFSIAPITGNPRQQFIPTRQFPLQATEACWTIGAANPHLKERLTLLVASLLKRLDALEDELEENTKGTTTPRTVP